MSDIDAVMQAAERLDLRTKPLGWAGMNRCHKKVVLTAANHDSVFGFRFMEEDGGEYNLRLDGRSDKDPNLHWWGDLLAEWDDNAMICECGARQYPGNGNTETGRYRCDWCIAHPKPVTFAS